MQLHIGIEQDLLDKLIVDLTNFNKENNLNLSISQYVAMLIKKGRGK